MQSIWRSLFCFAWTLVFSLTAIDSSAAENGNEQRVLATSRSGEQRVEQRGEEYWLVPTRVPAQAKQIPVASPEAAPVEIHFSPNDEWFFTLPDGASCVREGSLFHRDETGIHPVKSFNETAWAQAAKLRAVSKDFLAAEACRMMRFTSWSLDSTRLLVALRGGEGKFEMEGAFLYFHTGTKRWELTPYLEKVNKSSSDILHETMPCTEPAGPLPPAEHLKERLAKLDAELNATYARQIAATPEDKVMFLRTEQRDWIKRRDAGLKLYLTFAKRAEKELRRLQFLGDVTAARLELPPEKWHLPEEWMY